MTTLLLMWVLQDRGPKIADVEQPRGDVTVVRGEERHAVRQIARRVVNGDLFDSDSIVTGDGAGAIVVFADDSRVTLDPGTEISIEQRNLREPTDAGKSIGRRICILSGHIVSDIVPSSDVQTEFDTPAGTAAVRGTMVDIQVEGVHVEVGITDGHGVFFQADGQGQWDIPDGATVGVEFDPVTQTLTIQNLSEIPIEGRLGDSVVDLPAEASAEIRFQADRLHLRGELRVFDETQGTWQDLPPEGSEVPPTETPMRPDFFMLVDASLGGAVPVDARPVLAHILQQFDVDPDTRIGEDLAQSLGTSVNVRLIDRFERPDDGLVGRGWIEFGPNAWEVRGGRARGTLPLGGGLRSIAHDVGHLQNFFVKADFIYSAINVRPFLAVNAFPSDAASGLGVQYRPATGTMVLVRPGPDASFSVPSIGAGNPVNLGLSFDGSTLCGHLRSGTIIASHCAPALNTPGDHIHVGGETLAGPSQTIQVDNVVVVTE